MQGKLNVSKAKAELCRRSLYEFVQEFWDVIIPEDPVWNWHIKYICDEVQEAIVRVCRLPERPAIFDGVRFLMPKKPREKKEYDLLVNVPPGSLKSTIITVMAPAWAWTIDQTLRVISASYSGDLSQDHAVRSRDIIQSDKYKLYFPEVEIRADQNNKNSDKLARARDATPKAEAGLVYVRASILEKIYYDSDQGILKFPNGAKQDLADTIAQAIQRHFGRPERKFAVGWRKNRTEKPAAEPVSLLND